MLDWLGIVILASVALFVLFIPIAVLNARRKRRPETRIFDEASTPAARMNVSLQKESKHFRQRTFRDITAQVTLPQRMKYEATHDIVVKLLGTKLIAEIRTEDNKIIETTSFRVPPILPPPIPPTVLSVWAESVSGAIKINPTGPVSIIAPKPDETSDTTFYAVPTRPSGSEKILFHIQHGPNLLAKLNADVELYSEVKPTPSPIGSLVSTFTITTNLHIPKDMAEIRLDSPCEFTIGRSEESNYSFTEDMAMSRSHARVLFRGSRFWIQDLESTNGTWKLDTRDSRGRRRIKLEEIADNDLFQIGDTVIRFLLTENQ